MENTYDIFDDLKGQIICMVTRSMDDVEDYNAFLEIANLISQIESKLEHARDDEAFWKNRALEYHREKNELKKKLEEVEKALGKED